MASMVGARRWIALSCSHGDEIDLGAAKFFLRFRDDWRPHVAIHLGDLFDFSSMRKGAGRDERNHDLDRDLMMGERFGDALFLKARTENYYLIGNHCARPWRLLQSTSAVVRRAAAGFVNGIKDMGRKWRARILPYDSRHGILRRGDLSFLHGFYHGEGAPKKHAIAYGQCIYGHTHAIEQAPLASLDRRVAMGVGCLANKDCDYMNTRAGKLRWGQGWAYGYFFKNGSSAVMRAEIIGGQVVAATDFKVYR